MKKARTPWAFLCLLYEACEIADDAYDGETDRILCMKRLVIRVRCQKDERSQINTANHDVACSRLLEFLMESFACCCCSLERAGVSTEKDSVSAP